MLAERSQSLAPTALDFTLQTIAINDVPRSALGFDSQWPWLTCVASPIDEELPGRMARHCPFWPATSDLSRRKSPVRVPSLP